MELLSIPVIIIAWLLYFYLDAATLLRFQDLLRQQVSESVHEHITFCPSLITSKFNADFEFIENFALALQKENRIDVVQSSDEDVKDGVPFTAKVREVRGRFRGQEIEEHMMNWLQRDRIHAIVLEPPILYVGPVVVQPEDRLVPLYKDLPLLLASSEKLLHLPLPRNLIKRSTERHVNIMKKSEKALSKLDEKSLVEILHLDKKLSDPTVESNGKFSEQTNEGDSEEIDFDEGITLIDNIKCIQSSVDSSTGETIERFHVHANRSSELQYISNLSMSILWKDTCFSIKLAPEGRSNDDSRFLSCVIETSGANNGVWFKYDQDVDFVQYKWIWLETGTFFDVYSDGTINKIRRPKKGITFVRHDI